MLKTKFAKKPTFLLDFFLILIITLPTFLSLLNGWYFSMHDDQHIVRLFLLETGVRQGDLYPRWVDGLGFGYGYPLFNFYPPLIYYIALIFRLLGFSLIWSIKLTFITGFILAAWGMFKLVKKLAGFLPGLLASCLYTYFFYHAVNIYVRGALAEFFSMAILPFVVLGFYNLYQQSNLRNGLLLGIGLAFLILAHPLIAFPSVFYWLFLAVVFFFLKKEKRLLYFKNLVVAAVFGLALSAFFWLPSLLERKFTLVDAVLTKELASYKIHFVYLSQLWQSVWGYGGSGAGLTDGMTFQLGKIQIGLVVASIVLAIAYCIFKKKKEIFPKEYLVFLFLAVFSVFMTTDYSIFIWDKISYLWYLQFPWRFLTFAAIFIALLGGYAIYFLGKFKSWLSPVAAVLFIILTIFVYQKYFHPNKYLKVTDQGLTNFDEVNWRISRSSFEFIPKDVRTKKSDLNTTIPVIEKKDLPKKAIEIISGKGEVEVVKNNFRQKIFTVKAETKMNLKINTFNFPGWQLFRNGQVIKINDNNDLKLITFSVKPGKHLINLEFENTFVRNIANILSGLSLLLLTIFLVRKDGSKD